MKRCALLATILAMTVLITQAASGDDPPPPAATATPSPQVAQAREFFNALAGRWDIESEMSPRPKDPLTKTRATETIERVGALGVAANYDGTIMGAPLNARYLLSFNSAKQMYTSAWLDNMSGLLLTCEGSFDAAGRVLTMRGGYDDPARPERASSVRQTIEMPDADTRIMHMWVANAAGEERLFFRNKYKRRS